MSDPRDPVASGGTPDEAGAPQASASGSKGTEAGATKLAEHAAPRGEQQAKEAGAGDDAEPGSAASPGESQADASGAAAPGGGYQVRLPSFEGPLDLLLHLIQQHELDILDIPIAFVTDKYVEYITLMQELNIDLASEYLVMAAKLTHIKSKMLLPATPDEEEEDAEEAEEDPRAELVRRLLEYQKYKNAAEELADRPLLGRDVFTRGAPAPSVEGPAPLAPVSLFKLVEAFKRILERAETTLDHQVEFERFSITDRINELADVLRERTRVQFEDLFAGERTRADLIVTFLAVLEMTRLRMTRLVQAAPLDPICIELTVSEEQADTLAAEAADRLEPEGNAEARGGGEPARSAEAGGGGESAGNAEAGGGGEVGTAEAEQGGATMQLEGELADSPAQERMPAVERVAESPDVTVLPEAAQRTETVAELQPPTQVPGESKRQAAEQSGQPTVSHGEPERPDDTGMEPE